MILDKELSLKHIEIPEAHIVLRHDEIVHVHYKKNTVLDVELQTRMRVIYHQLAGGKKLNFIFSADEGFVLTKEARENGPMIENDSPILFYALVANSLPYKIIANFHIKVTNPRANYKVFTNVNAALNWLQSLKAAEV